MSNEQKLEMTLDEALRAELAGEDHDVYILDACFKHFRALVDAEPGEVRPAIVAEGNRLLALMLGFDKPIEDESPLDSLICAIAAGAARSIYKAFGEMLGVGAEVVQHAVAGYTEGVKHEAIGLDGLGKELQRAEDFLSDLERRRAARIGQADDSLDGGSDGVERPRSP